ncbi:MAG: DUF5618 family protein [bacterium]
MGKIKKLRPEKTRKGLDNPESFFLEAERYYNNAKERLKEAKVEYNCYQDTKPVREACAMAYLSVLAALDGYFVSRGVSLDTLPKTTEGYLASLRKYLVHNGKLQSAFRVSWENLHVFGYYRGASSIDLVKDGFKNAKVILDMLSKDRAKSW